MPLFDIPVFIGLTGLDLLTPDSIVPQQTFIGLGEFFPSHKLLTAALIRRSDVPSEHRLAARMHSKNAALLCDGLLNRHSDGALLAVVSREVPTTRFHSRGLDPQNLAL